jgi:ferric-dicitrate binding protein FerR (iron transport regulator)
MSLSARIFRSACAPLTGLILIFMAGANVAHSQSSTGGCVLERVGGTSRMLLRCRDGLTIIVEAGARFSLIDRNRDGNADAARLQRKALLLNAPASQAVTGFQVITPQAIAAVRGTKWAVDVQDGKTSVFVVRGRVAVQRPSASAGVLLGPGDGVDVAPGSEPLVVKRWPRARESALLARFGQ